MWRFRTTLMHSAAGLMFLAAAAVMLFDPATTLVELGPEAFDFSKLLMAAWPLPFLAIALRGWPNVRRAVLVLVAALFPIIGFLAFRTAGTELLPMGILFGLAILFSGFIIEESSEERSMFILCGALGLIIYGLGGALSAVGGFGTAATELAWHLPPFDVGLIIAAIGGFTLAVEWRRWRGWPAGVVFIAAAAAYLVVSYLRYEDLLYFTASSFAVISGLFSYHAVRRVLLRTAEAQAVINEAEHVGRFNETAFWLSMTVAGLYAAYDPLTDRLAYLVSAVTAILGVGAMKSAWARRSPGIGRTLGSIVVVSIAFAAMIHATGGLASPMVFLAFAAMFAVAEAVSERLIRAVMVLYVLYFAGEAFYSVAYRAEDPTEALVRAILLSGAMIFTGVFTSITIRKHDAALAELRASKIDLEASLVRSTQAQEREKRQADELRRVNAESVEMRSALMNVLEDVEESKKVTERDNRRDEAIFFSIAEGLVAATRDRNIFLFNPAASGVTGISREEAVGKPIDQVFRLASEDSDLLKTDVLDDAFAGHQTKLPPKLAVMRKDGVRIPVAGAAAPFFDERGDLLGVIVAFRDVTFEREVDRQKSGFISIASHQLRTPLSGIRWFLDLLLGGDAGALKPQQKEFLTDIYTSTTRMINLVNDLLNVSRLEQGRVLLNPIQLDVGEILDIIEKDHIALLTKKKLKFAKSVEKGLPKVFADKNAIHQALANLVANAINYTPEGGKITVKAHIVGKDVTVEISDTGIGIPKTQQHRIFERFFRGANAISRETVGSGLGLHITKTMIESAGGNIRFESVEGKGTTFFVTLPVPASKGTLST